MKKVKGITHQEVMAKGFKNDEERAGYEEARNEMRYLIPFDASRYLDNDESIIEYLAPDCNHL